MDKVYLFKSPSGKIKHLAIPNSVDGDESVDNMVPYCGRFFNDKTDKETYDNIEVAMKSTEICINCLNSVGAIESPKLTNEN